MKTVEEIQNIIDASRRRIGFHYGALSEEINLTMRLRKSIRRQPWSWMGGALATGMIFNFFKRGCPSLPCDKESSPQKRSSLFKHAASLSSLLLGETTLALAAGKFLRFLFPLLQPIIMQYAARKFHSSEKEHRVFDVRP